MKKILWFLILVFGCFSLNGQSWNWADTAFYTDPGFAYQAGGPIVSIDNLGNIFYTDNGYAYVNVGKFDKSGNLLWYKTFPAVNGHSYAVAGYKGMSYITGYFTGTLIFGTDTLRTKNSFFENIFIAKFDAVGNLLWAKQDEYSSTGQGGGKSIIVDTSGNPYITGIYTLGAIKFGNDSAFTKSNMAIPFVAKFDSSGNLIWLKGGEPGETGGWAEAYAIAVDNSGNSAISGYYVGSIAFGNDTLPITYSLYTENTYVFKFDNNGNPLWCWGANSLPGSAQNYSVGVGIDGYGDTYLAGDFYEGTYAIGSHSFGFEKETTPFFAKFNPTGAVGWAQEIKKLDTNTSMASFFAMDAANNGYILIDCPNENGSYKQNIGTDTFRLNLRYFNSTADILVQLDTAGNVTCGTIFTEGDENDGDGMNVSQSGKYVIVAGDVGDTAIIGKDTLVEHSSYEHLFLASWQHCDSNVETSINPISNENSTSVYPNPSKGSFTLELTNVEGKCEVEVYNLLGEKVLKQILRPAQDDKVINLMGQPNGIYFYRVLRESGGLVGEGKVVIEK